MRGVTARGERRSHCKESAKPYRYHAHAGCIKDLKVETFIVRAKRSIWQLQNITNCLTKWIRTLPFAFHVHFPHILDAKTKFQIISLSNLMCSMSVHCIIRNNKHQLMHQNIYNLYSWKSPTCFDPAGPSSGRIILIHYGCVYTVKCECALRFIHRLRGIVYCPRCVSEL
jgi:hypothetical protein